MGAFRQKMMTYFEISQKPWFFAIGLKGVYLWALELKWELSRHKKYATHEQRHKLQIMVDYRKIVYLNFCNFRLNLNFWIFFQKKCAFLGPGNRIKVIPTQPCYEAWVESRVATFGWYLGKHCVRILRNLHKT